MSDDVESVRVGVVVGLAVDVHVPEWAPQTQAHAPFSTIGTDGLSHRKAQVDAPLRRHIVGLRCGRHERLLQVCWPFDRHETLELDVSGKGDVVQVPV